MKKVSLIITVLNEEKTILSLLRSVGEQALFPDEVIIVDGGSTDRTAKLIKIFLKKSLTARKFPIKVFIKKGNRSVGRNHAIEKANYAWIAVTDAGCVLDKNWLKELVKKQGQSGAEVVAGYYSAIAETSFQEAVVPYVLVMPDKVDENNFLPATRSVLFSRKIWKNIGGFDENFSDNEDYDFAKRLELSGTKMSFSKDAVANWIPRSTLKSFNNMIFRFARGDIYVGIIRPKVLLIFSRYLLGYSVFVWGVEKFTAEGNLWILFGLIPALVMIYILWSIYKNYRYVSRDLYWLPMLQVSSDLAVMWGSVCGLFQRVFEPKIRR